MALTDFERLLARQMLQERASREGTDAVISFLECGEDEQRADVRSYAEKFLPEVIQRLANLQAEGQELQRVKQRLEAYLAN